MNQERKITFQDFWEYVGFRGIGCKGRFDFSLRHYIHYSTETITKIMQVTLDYISLVGDKEFSKCLLELLYYTAKTDMIPQLKSRGDPVPKIFLEIQELHKKLSETIEETRLNEK